MSPEHGRAVDSLVGMLDAALQRLSRSDARSFIDGLSDEELADVMAAKSAASVAQGGTGNLLYESAAARLRGVDVGCFGSGPGACSSASSLKTKTLKRQEAQQ